MLNIYVNNNYSAVNVEADKLMLKMNLGSEHLYDNVMQRLQNGSLNPNSNFASYNDLKFTFSTHVLGLAAETKDINLLAVALLIKKSDFTLINPQQEINDYCMEFKRQYYFQYASKSHHNDYIENRVVMLKSQMHYLFDALHLGDKIYKQEEIKKGTSFLLCFKDHESPIARLPFELISEIVLNLFNSYSNIEQSWKDEIDYNITKSICKTENDLLIFPQASTKMVVKSKIKFKKNCVVQ